MSPKTQEDELLGLRFPRLRGDEPEGVIRSWEIGKFSPPTRG